jgi:hypothetical protein
LHLDAEEISGRPRVSVVGSVVEDNQLTSLQTFHEIGPKDTPKKKAKIYTIKTEITPLIESFASSSSFGGGSIRTKYAKSHNLLVSGSTI